MSNTFSYPSLIIEDERFSLVERVVLPMVAHFSLQYGELKEGKTALEMARILRLDVNEVLTALHTLRARQLVQEHHQKLSGERVISWQVGSAFIKALNGIYEPQKSLKRSILDLDLAEITDLESEAFIKLHTLGLGRDVWDTWYAHARAEDVSAQNFMHEFMQYIQKTLHSTKRHTGLVMHDSTKATPQEFALAQEFHAMWRSVYPQHQEPHNMMLEAVNIKTLHEIKGFSLEAIKEAMQWLFSDVGKWFRPNVKSAVVFRQKFDFIHRHVMAHKGQSSPLTPGMNVFDLIDEHF